MPSHKVLESISHNFTHSLISTINYSDDDYFLGHLLTQMKSTKLNRLEVNILQNTITPVELATETIRSMLWAENRWFPNLVVSSNFKMEFISTAILIIIFDLDTQRYNKKMRHLEHPFMCET